MNIAEKLGIKPIELPGVKHMDVIREFEQQKNKMLEILTELRKTIDHPDYTWNEKDWEVILDTLITKADPKHRPWSEIKELI